MGSWLAENGTLRNTSPERTRNYFLRAAARPLAGRGFEPSLSEMALGEASEIVIVPLSSICTVAANRLIAVASWAESFRSFASALAVFGGGGALRMTKGFAGMANLSLACGSTQYFATERMAASTSADPGRMASSSTGA